MANIHKSELVVITKVKDLSKYIFTITINSPKKFRFTLINRMQDISIDIIEALYLTNEIFLNGKDKLNELEKRNNLQRSVLTKLKILDYVAEVSKEQQCILPKQYEQIAKQILECRNLVGAWMQSDKEKVKL